jgi:hypothetical protein
VSRNAWTALFVGIAALGTVVATAILVIGGGGSSGSNVETTPSSGTRGFALPLGEQAGTLALAGHAKNALVLVAARPGTLEIAAVRAETPFSRDELEIKIGGNEVQAGSCGQGCSRIEAPVLQGQRQKLTVAFPGGEVGFELPAKLPASGDAVFARALKTMDDLRAYRFSERLSSGGPTVVSRLQVEAPNRLALQTGGFRSVIIGKRRWNNMGAGWEEQSFPGLDVADVLMWHGAKHPRVIGTQNGVTTLAAYGLIPVPAWFKLAVLPSGRVANAEMLAASHFMLHRYSDYNGDIAIKPPK